MIKINYRILLTWIILLLINISFLKAQITYEYDPSIAVFIDGNPKRLPWSGGINAGQYQTIDLDLDGIEDLIVFDRTSNKVNCFLWKENQYIYSPDYEALFPKDINGWIILEDFNCDGQQDLFTSSAFGMKAYTGSVANGEIKWRLAADPINTVGFSGEINLQVNVSDIPAIVDIDDDGDLDIFVFNFAIGGTIEFHENKSNEEGNPCGLYFERTTNKWGDFQECSCGIYAFGTSCSEINGRKGSPQNKLLHAGGKALVILDIDGDGVKDMLFGDEECSNLVSFKNYGTKENALFQTFDENFPDNELSPAFLFPAGYYQDVDHNGLKDLLIAPNLSENPSNQVDFTRSSWLYKNTGTEEAPTFSFVQNNFLQEDMIDRGENAAPAFSDYNGDNLIDLWVGNKDKMNDDGHYATLALFENTGTPSEPIFSLFDEDFLKISSMGLHAITPGFGDINGDGQNDLYFSGTSLKDDETAIYYVLAENASIPANAALQVLPFSLSSSDSPRLGDLNGDGFADLVIAKASGRIEYYEFSGTSSSIAYQLVSESFAGFTDKFENRNLLPFISDVDADGNQELLLSDANGSLHLIKAYFSHATGLQGADSLLTYNKTFDRSNVSWFGRQSQIAFAPLFVGEKPALVVGSRQGGLFFLRNKDRSSGPGQEQDLVLEIFPNPTEAMFTIRTNQSAQVAVYDVTGKEVMDSFMFEGRNSYQFESASLSAGVYIVKATLHTGKSVAKKLIVL